MSCKWPNSLQKALLIERFSAERLGSKQTSWTGFYSQIVLVNLYGSVSVIPHQYTKPVPTLKLVYTGFYNSFRSVRSPYNDGEYYRFIQKYFLLAKKFLLKCNIAKMLGKAHNIYWMWNNFWRYAPQQTPLKVKTYGKVHNIYQISKKSLRYAPRRHPNQFEAVN